MKSGFIALLLTLTMSSGVAAQGGPSHPSLHSPPPTMSARTGANRTGAFEPLNPGLTLPDTAILGTNTPMVALSRGSSSTINYTTARQTNCMMKLHFHKGTNQVSISRFARARS
jgi:hypothetical protein